MNLELIIPILDEKVNLKNLNESNPELLFIYEEENNYVKYAPKQKKKENKYRKLILDKIKNIYKLRLYNSLHINENIEINRKTIP